MGKMREEVFETSSENLSEEVFYFITICRKYMKDKNRRSIMKAISWRIVGSIDTIAISYFITGSVKSALSIGFTETFTKITIYYFHERLWERIKFGKESKPKLIVYQNKLGNGVYEQD
jgi:uncharacterized membrane protein